MNAPESRRRPPRVARTGLLAVVAVVGGLIVLNLLPGSLNPFRSRDVDHSAPAVLKSVADIGEYRAATANLQLVVDLERDTRFVPDFLKGERTRLFASGTVDAGVDFSRLDRDAVSVDRDARRLTVRLPSVRLYPPRVDLSQSRVLGRDRGLFDRIGSVFGAGSSDRGVYVLAERRLAEGAAADPTLTVRAKENTERMLRTLGGSLGYREVVVDFAAPASS